MRALWTHIFCIIMLILHDLAGEHTYCQKKYLERKAQIWFCRWNFSFEAKPSFQPSSFLEPKTFSFTKLLFWSRALLLSKIFFVLINQAFLVNPTLFSIKLFSLHQKLYWTKVYVLIKLFLSCSESPADTCGRRGCFLQVQTLHLCDLNKLFFALVSPGRDS